MANIIGENTDPCGTPCFIGCWTDDIELLILMVKCLLNKKFLNHKRGISFSPIFCNLFIIVLKSSISNAEDKSSSISCWDLLLTSEVYKSSKSENRVISELCPFRKSFCFIIK